MKVLKKFLIIMLSMIVLLSVGNLQAFAITETQDEVEVNFTTNKEKYTKDEQIIATLTVKNISEIDIKNVSIESLTPKGYKTVDNAKINKQIEILRAGESSTLSVAYILDNNVNENIATDKENTVNQNNNSEKNNSNQNTIQATNNTNVNQNNSGKVIATGSNVCVEVISIAFLLGLGIVIFLSVKKKKTKNVISVFLCVAILGSTLPFLGIDVSAVEEQSSKSISVDLIVKCDNKDTNLSAMVCYQIDNSNSSESHTVNFDLNYEEAEVLPSVTVKSGEYLTLPQAPERDNYIFTGWYTDENLSKYFDAETTPINEDITLFAGWLDFNDTTDTDGDKIVDSLEVLFGTDKTKSDTDGDGLSDYIEIESLELDPLKVDTDNNTVGDGDEDIDGDGLTNLQEVKIGTDLLKSDTDNDGLSDYDEDITYGTNPLLADTDGDGAVDGKEIELGTNPLIADDSFNINVTSSEDDTIKASVETILSGEQVDTLSVEKVENKLLFPNDMPGYIGGAYDFNVDGSFESATIKFEFDSSLSDDPTFDPVIYYFNEETQLLEELETTLTGNTATAKVTHFSKYILLNRTVYEDSFTWTDVWDANDYTGVEVVLVIDDSGSMDSNDRSDNRLTVAQNLIDNLPENSKIGVVKFSSGTSLLTESLTSDRDLAKSYLTTSYFKSSGGTYMYRAIDSSFSLFENEDDSILKMMVVLSDGATSDTNMQSSVISYANEQKVKIYTVGLGNSTQYFSNYLDPLANNTGAKFYLASNADQLTEIYDDISEKIDIETDSDSDGIPDYYEDNMVIFNGIKLTLDKNNPDTDGDGLFDGEEIAEFNYKYNEDRSKVIVTGKMKSNPTSIDSDGDGLYDNQARLAKGEIVAPKDPDSTKPNGPAGIWDAHVFQQTYGINPDDYSDSTGLELEVDKRIADILVQIALKLREPVNQNEVVIRNVALFIKQFCKGEMAAVAGSYILNFIYDEDYIAYHSQPDTWQRNFGYNDFYDDVFRIGSFMKFEDFEFLANDSRYVLWMWKGDYWNLHSGAEIGLYTNPEIYSGTAHYDVVDFELPMTLSLYNYNSKVSIENVFSWRPNVPQWWVTGFNPKFTNPNPESMVSIGSIDFSGYENLYNGLKSAKDRSDNPDKYNNYLIFDEDGHTVWIIWYEGVEI